MAKGKIGLDGLSAAEQAKFVSFAGASGNYTTKVEGSETATVQVSGTLQVIVSPKVTGRQITNWRAMGGTAYNYGGYSTTQTRTDYSLSPTVTGVEPGGNEIEVIDAHGTHYGLPNGTTKIYPLQFIGVMHATTAAGYAFTGWKITAVDGSRITLNPGVLDWTSGMPHRVVSSGGTKNNNVVTFACSDTGSPAVCIHTASSTSDVYDLTIEALYTSTTCTLTFNDNGGSGGPGAQTFTSNVAFNLSSTTPTRSGYAFLGWSESASATTATYTAGQSVTFSTDKTLYAVWNETRVAIAFVSEPGTTNMPPNTTSQRNVSYTIPSNVPVYSDYVFLGWRYSVDSQTYQPSATVQIGTESVTFTARWQGVVPPGPHGSGSGRLAFYGSGALVYGASGNLKFA